MTRKFTDEFSLGDEVSIIRTRHGWHDGALRGPIVELSDHACVVEVLGDRLFNGDRYDIDHPRDIRIVRRA